MMIKKGQVPGGNLSPEQLETSWELVQQQKKNFLEGRLGLLIDGSGRNVQDIRENMDMLLQLGYDVACVFVNVDLNVSMARAAQRSQQQAAKHGTGRNVPEDLQRMAHGAVQRNVPRLKELFGNNFFEVDNTSTPDLRDVQKRINSWLRTPPSKPQALEWIRSQQIQRKR
jgi:hypothetical protein